MSGVRGNWAGNVSFTARRHACPTSAAELSSLVASAGSARALGSGHSFSTIADTGGVLISTTGLNAVELDESKETVRVGAGARYGDVLRVLRADGRTLANLASLPHITVGGAVVTATHGSGVKNPSLASAVVAFEIVLADGGTIRIDRDDVRFAGSVVNVGALGILTSLTLATVEEFQVAQWVFEDVPWETVETSLLELLGLGYSASIFLSWAGRSVEQLWIKSTETSAPTAPGTPASSARHPIRGADPRHCTEQLGRRGPAGERLPHFRYGGVPSVGEELQSEWSVGRDHARAVFAALRELGPKIAPALHVSEIRTVAADRFWLSPFSERDSVSFHFTWKPSDAAWSMISRVEEALGPYRPRPHWGKLFSVNGRQLRDVYPRFDDFRTLRRSLDPRGKFLNPFLVELGLD